jgi:hypothetical protein
MRRRTILMGKWSAILSENRNNHSRNSCYRLPAIRIEYPKSTCNCCACLLQIGNSPDDGLIGHVFERIIVLVDRKNSWMIGLLLVEQQKITRVERQDHLICCPSMGKVSIVGDASQWWLDLCRNLNLISGF